MPLHVINVITCHEISLCEMENQYVDINVVKFGGCHKIFLLGYGGYSLIIGTVKQTIMKLYDDVIKWKYFSRYWPFVRRIHRSPVNSPHKGPRRGALMFSLICAWTNSWSNNGDTGELRRVRAHYDVIVMIPRESVMDAQIDMGK